MTDSNRTRLSYVAESTVGTTPAISGSTVMREMRITGESLNHGITNVVSEELRSDRQIPDILQVGAQGGGDLNFELSYPDYRTFHEEFLAAALFSSWDNQPVKHNIVADTELANVGAGTGVYTVDAGGTAFVANHLVRATGFTNAANNGLFTVTASTATSVTTSNSSSVAETAPPIGAMLKVIGLQGASGDIVTAVTPNRITSTSANFVTLGIKVGDFIKIGDASNTNFQFATAALNTWVRVAAVSANSITVDNIPSGVTWSADTGTGKTIRIFTPDRVDNGVTERSFTIEKGFMAQATPSYLVYRGCEVNQVSLNLQPGAIITGAYSLISMTHGASTTSLGVPVAAGIDDVLTAASNVGRLAEGGSDQVSPNLSNQLSLSLSNNLRPRQAVGTLGLIGMGAGRCEISGSLSTYFGSLAIYNKFVNGTTTSLNFRTTNPLSGGGNRGFVVSLPAIELTTSQASASAGNQDVFAQFNFQAKRDTTSGQQDDQIRIYKFDYVN